LKRFYLNIIVLLLFVITAKAQKEKNVVAKFTFNNKSLVNEINSKPAKAIGKSFVNDRFGNAESAIFLYGGNGSYINLGTDDSLKPTKGTIALWFNMENATFHGAGYGVNPFILTKNNNGDDFFEGYSMVYDYYTRRIWAGATFSEKIQLGIYSIDKVKLLTWNHIVMTYNDDSLSFYLNGKRQSTILKNFRSVFLKGDSVMIGNSANKKNSRFFNGLIDDIYIYDRVLNAQEVKELYEQPNPNRVSNILKWVFNITSIILGIFLIVLFFIKRQKKIFNKEKERIELKTRLQEMETRAIRLQMNPHFIFNALNSLQRLILEEDIIKANDYLTKFSLMLRRILESYDSDNISLKEELEILDTYINIEKLRFGHSFEYTIHSDVKNAENIFIPFMLIQPIIENAIWHGLLPKEGIKKLTVQFTDNPGFIKCIVEDNGVGRNTKKQEPTQLLKKRSMALDFIKQRLAILTEVTGIQGKIVITDKKDGVGKSEGTLVELLIPKR
jgi:uncharacterized membrane protein